MTRLMVTDRPVLPRALPIAGGFTKSRMNRRLQAGLRSGNRRRCIDDTFCIAVVRVSRLISITDDYPISGDFGLSAMILMIGANKVIKIS